MMYYFKNICIGFLGIQHLDPSNNESHSMQIDNT